MTVCGCDCRKVLKQVLKSYIHSLWKCISWPLPEFHTQRTWLNQETLLKLACNVSWETLQMQTLCL